MTEVFRLGDDSQGLFRQLAEGIGARLFFGDHIMLSVVTLEPNAVGALHHHPEEQWGVMLEGEGVRTQDGERFRVSPGDFWRTPPDVPHAFEAGPNGAKVLDVFSPPRDDYRTPGSGFGGDTDSSE